MTEWRQSLPAAGEEQRENTDHIDAIVIGAGVSGLYQVYCLREAGLSVRCFDKAGGVGGTWFWNRYPGCTFDSPSQTYGYSFSAELLGEWDWKHYYSFQPDTEEYLNLVADKFDLRRHITLNACVKSARWNERERLWTVELEDGERTTASFLIPAVGHLSEPFVPSIEGMDLFQGEAFHTLYWPREDPDFTGKRVAVIGTGASGIQVIPHIAKRAGHLTVFQRTANYGIPSDNAPIDPEDQQQWKSTYDEIHAEIRQTPSGTQVWPDPRSGHDVTREERLAAYEEAWKRRGFEKFLSLFWDVLVDHEINAEYSDFLREKIRARINDPVVAEKLTPKTHPFGAKRIPMETNYYETFNRDNVLLVDAHETPIERMTETGIKTSEREYEFDVIIYATGFDGVTGSLTRMDIRGLGGRSLKDKWSEKGFSTYLGLTSTGFPNFFISNNSAVCNYTVCAEWIAEWITDCIRYMREHGYDRIEPTQEAEEAWVEHHNEAGMKTLWADAESSWYFGSNSSLTVLADAASTGERKQRFVLYAQSGPAWRKECFDAMENDYEGFAFSEALEPSGV